MSLGQGVRALRKSRQQSLDQLAVSARIPCVTLALIEADQYFPRLAELERLLAALRVQLCDLCVVDRKNPP